MNNTTAINILDELPEEARAALTQKAVRDGSPIADVISSIVMDAAKRLVTSTRESAPPSPESHHEVPQTKEGAN